MNSILLYLSGLGIQEMFLLFLFLLILVVPLVVLVWAVRKVWKHTK